MSLRSRKIENWLHLEVKSTTHSGTHSTGKPQMVMGDSEHLPEESTREDRECKMCI